MRNISKLICLVLLAACVLALPAAALAAPTVPVPFSFGTTSAAGLTTYGVYDSNNTTILQTGDSAQLIWVGPNGTIDPPACGLLPGGDDWLLGTSSVRNNLPGNLLNKGYIPLTTATLDSDAAYMGGSAYIRAWNANLSTETPTYYGNSALGTISAYGSYNALRWYTNLPNSFTETSATWVGGPEGNWQTASNWSNSQVPDGWTNVVIPAGTTVHLTAYATTCALTVSRGATLDLDSYNLGVAGTFTNAGTLRARRAVSGALGYAREEFLHVMNPAHTVDKYRGADVAVAAGGELGDVTVTVRAIDPASSEYCTNTGVGSPLYANRCYQIDSTLSYTATVRLWVFTSDLNGVPVDGTAVYRYDGNPIAWTELISPTRGTSGAFAWAQADSAHFSHFLLGATGNIPTAVSLADGRVAAPPAGLAWGPIGLLLAVLAVVLSAVWLRNRQAGRVPIAAAPLAAPGAALAGGPRKPYATPAAVQSERLETRAGSPFDSEFDPNAPLWPDM